MDDRLAAVMIPAECDAVMAPVAEAIPLVMIRGTDGCLYLFHNIVPYDGCLAVMSEHKELTEIETYYHKLFYDLAGKLTCAPYWNTDPNAGREGLEGRDGDLVEIPSEERMGVLFVNLDG